jgi:peptide/nickel transport system substrate-binding protein
LVTVAAACGSDKKSDKGASEGSTSTTAAETVPTGGTLVVGAEQEPDCTDWVGSCGGSSWGYWMMNVTTMPRAFNVVKDGDSYAYKASDVMASEPTLDDSNPDKPVVTYKINPKAVWSDGSPITSTDFKFTWEQIAKGNDIYDRTGYDKIESVDDSKPDTAVVHYAEPYADWKGLFGGGYGILPSKLIKDHSEMANGYTWSAGPWKIDHWTKGTEAVLVPNDKYWGTKPKLDKIVYKFIADTSAEFQAFKAGEVLVAYPQPQLDAIDAIQAGLSGANSAVSAVTGNAEALWMNNQKAPFDDKTFRQAVAYSIDRDAIVKRLFGGIKVDKALQTFTAPIVKDYATLDAFSKYTKDLDKVKSLMEGAGWAKGSDGFWAKGGQKATFTIQSTAGNKRRELTEQVLQEQLKEAGFDMKIQNQKAGDLFGDIAPKGNYQVALYANVLTTAYPSNCNIFCSKNIPTAENGFSGNNWYRVAIPALDEKLLTVDKELDTSKAKAANKEGDKISAENVISLPLDPLPNILLWSDKVVGTVQDNAVMGPFFSAVGWGVKS